LVIQFKEPSVVQEITLAETLLVAKQDVMHFPELPLHASTLRRHCCTGRQRMHGKRKVMKRDQDLPGVDVGVKDFWPRILRKFRTVGTLEVRIDQPTLAVDLPAVIDPAKLIGSLGILNSGLVVGGRN
jgi:hypothetical protein